MYKLEKILDGVIHFAKNKMYADAISLERAFD